MVASVSSAGSYANAIAAYARAGKAVEPESTTVPEAPGDTFAALVKNAVHGAVSAAESGERMSVAAITDGADIGQVVTAVAEAELTLQAVIAIRDKVIQAYKEISQMPI
ncbi:MAG: flagellar hook-basal body complex protein FliE [Rhodospirillales bacterium]|nr:flagellar hook-basal body complex protein FliE [Rhodospirillales bacterium]